MKTWFNKKKKKKHSYIIIEVKYTCNLCSKKLYMMYDKLMACWTLKGQQANTYIKKKNKRQNTCHDIMTMVCGTSPCVSFYIIKNET